MCQKNAIKNAIMVRSKAAIAHAARPGIESRAGRVSEPPYHSTFSSCSLPA